MAQDKKTALDGIDWDAMAKDLLGIFNYSKERVTSNYASKEEKLMAGQAASTAALALTQLAAQARAEREAGERETFKIGKP